MSISCGTVREVPSTDAISRDISLELLLNWISYIVAFPAAFQVRVLLSLSHERSLSQDWGFTVLPIANASSSVEDTVSKVGE